MINLFLIRPYVILFLIAFLFLSIRRWGVAKGLIWLVSGYLLAWASEVSSIHNGFPYGQYYYVYENLRGELLFFGVPFFDSLSYAFLCFAGFTTASFFLKKENSFKTVLLGAFLTMLLDVIIDPVATMGELWFLGKIHYYAHPGWYFGVPLTNFAGWFLVAFAIIGFNVLFWKMFLPSTTDDRRPTTNILYPLFYISIALFNIIMSFWIKQWFLGITSTIILILIFIIPWTLKKLGRQKIVS
ncbi:MAG: carotenoid biosynthesis protein [Pseudomonadota bacterium]